MKTMIVVSSTLVVAALALGAFPMAAQAGTADAAPLFEPAPAEQMKPNKCSGQEELLSTTWDWLFQDPADCEPTCVSFCEDNGGRLLSATYSSRDFTCRCNCCVPK